MLTAAAQALHDPLIAGVTTDPPPPSLPGAQLCHYCHEIVPSPLYVKPEYQRDSVPLPYGGRQQDGNCCRRFLAHVQQTQLLSTPEGGMRCTAGTSPDFGVGAELHHIIAAQAMLPPLLAVVSADGLAIQEGAIQAASVGDLPAALTGVPPDDDMVAGHLSVGHRQGVVIQPPNSHLLTQEQHVSHAVR